MYRRRRPFGGGDPGDQDEDFGVPGGNDGYCGSTGGGGGGDWGSDGDEEGGHWGNIASAVWLWRALCVCSVLQVHLTDARHPCCFIARPAGCVFKCCTGACMLFPVASRFSACAVVFS